MHSEEVYCFSDAKGAVIWAVSPRLIASSAVASYFSVNNLETAESTSVHSSVLFLMQKRQKISVSDQ